MLLVLCMSFILLFMSRFCVQLIVMVAVLTHCCFAYFVYRFLYVVEFVDFVYFAYPFLFVRVYMLLV